MASVNTMEVLSLRISLTDRCNLRCGYCVPGQDACDVEQDRILSDEQIGRFVELLGRRYRISHVRLTGGEPLVRPNLPILIHRLRQTDVGEIALTTNGQCLSGKAATLKQAGLDRVNISLDSLRPAVFAAITRGGVLEKTLDGIRVAREVGLLPVKLNAVVLRGVNDQEAPDLVRFAMDEGVHIRFLELMPVGEAARDFDRLFVSSEETRARLRQWFALDPVASDPRSTSRNWLARDGRGRTAVVGFVSPVSEPFCSGCPRLRLTARGTLIGCVARSDGVPVAHFLRQDGGEAEKAFYRAVQTALGMKRGDGHFIQSTRMLVLGG
jgi:cyclic pyranopterin phosphate synthase